MWWKRLMILLGIIPAFAVAFVVAPAPIQASAAKTGGVLVARPAEIDFHKKFAGTRTYKRTKITNTGQTACCCGWLIRCRIILATIIIQARPALMMRAFYSRPGPAAMRS
jgi:hypothetical protein